MERLKVAENYCHNYQGKEFTFQYGEIKRWMKKNGKMQLQKFTFQYGEIKRHYSLFVNHCQFYIYIPVWRD